MLIKRFANILGQGLVGSLTGIDLTDMVNKGGLLGTATGIETPGLSAMGGLTDLLYRPGDKAGINKMPYYSGQDNGGLMQLPYYPGTQKGQRLHGIADFDGNYNPTFDIPGGPITPEERQRMNKNYPIGNIGK